LYIIYIQFSALHWMSTFQKFVSSNLAAKRPTGPLAPLPTTPSDFPYDCPICNHTFENESLFNSSSHQDHCSRALSDEPHKHCIVHGSDLDEDGICDECNLCEDKRTPVLPSASTPSKYDDYDRHHFFDSSSMPHVSYLSGYHHPTHCHEHGDELNENVCNGCNADLVLLTSTPGLRVAQFASLTHFATIARCHIYKKGWIPKHHSTNCLCLACCPDFHDDSRPYDDDYWDNSYWHDPCLVHGRDNCVDCEPTTMACDECMYGEVDRKSKVYRKSGKCDYCLPKVKTKGGTKAYRRNYDEC
jgi:hypothetical protein